MHYAVRIFITVQCLTVNGSIQLMSACSCNCSHKRGAREASLQQSPVVEEEEDFVFVCPDEPEDFNVFVDDVPRPPWCRFDDDFTFEHVPEANVHSLECNQTHQPAAKYDRLVANKKKLKKTSNKKGQHKRDTRLNGKSIKHSMQCCQSCTCQTSACHFVEYHTIKKLREELYGEGSNRKTQRQWRFAELLSCHENTVKEKSRLGISLNSGLLYYHIDGRFTPDHKDLPVCRRCYQEILGVSAQTIDDTRKLIVKEGVRTETSSVGAPKIKEDSAERLQVSAWIEMFCQSLVCYSPDEKRHELPLRITLTGMWEEFCRDWRDGVIKGAYFRSCFGRLSSDLRSHDRPPGYDLFRKIWKVDFDSKIKIPRRHKRFPLCNWCARMLTNMKKAKTHEERVFWRSELFSHYLWVTAQRKVYYRHRQKAIKEPGKYVHNYI